MEKPKQTYIFSIGGLSFAKGIPYMLEQAASQSDFWKEIPFDLIFYLFVSFTLGQLVQDFYNKDSWIRVNFRILTKKFEVTRTYINAEESPRRLVIRTHIKFTKKINDGRLILKIYSCTGLERKPVISLLLLEQLNNVIEGEEREIILATKAIPHPGWEPFNSTFGPEVNDKPKHLLGRSKNVLEIELQTKFFTQREKFFIEDLFYGSKDHGFGLYVQTEDENIFKV